MSSKGALSIIDYPFAFSLVATIFFPLMLQHGVKDQGTILLSITFFGSMVGSILMIVNPVGRLITAIYGAFKDRVLVELSSINGFVKGVVRKNFRSALQSPSITYEVDKLVGMFYFVIILGITLYRLSYDDTFVTMLNLNPLVHQTIMAVAVVGLLAVIIIMAHHVGWRSHSHLRRIRSVTVLLMAMDFSNLSLEGNQVLSRAFNNDVDAIRLAYVTLTRSDLKPVKELQDLKEFVSRHGSELRAIVSEKWKWDDHAFYQHYWDYFLTAKSLALGYNIDLLDALLWLCNNIFFGLNEFDTYISQLQASIESRDWQNSDLQTVRVVSRFESVSKSHQLS